VEQTVPVRREKARLEREPITDANVYAATSGPDISEEEHEVVLREEEPVVEKRVVPRERVRLDKETVTGGCGLRPPSDPRLSSQHRIIDGGRPDLPAGVQSTPDRPGHDLRLEN
jgi:hypothetical protein